MQCPDCLREDNGVTSTATPYGSSFVFRLRKCRHCGHEWVTQENRTGITKAEFNGIRNDIRRRRQARA